LARRRASALLVNTLASASWYAASAAGRTTSAMAFATPPLGPAQHRSFAGVEHTCGRLRKQWLRWSRSQRAALGVGVHYGVLYYCASALLVNCQRCGAYNFGDGLRYCAVWSAQCTTNKSSMGLGIHVGKTVC
jgi:hypothetical protein